MVQLPADLSLISLAYHHEHPVQAYEFENTLEVWTVSARIDADVLAEDLAAYSDMDQEALDAVQDVTVGRMSFVRRGGRPRQPVAPVCCLAVAMT